MARSSRRPKAAVKDDRAAKAALVIGLSAGIVAALLQLLQ